MHKILFSIVLLSVFWAACTKSELPTGVSNNPVFRVQYTVDTPQTLIAGIGDTYLFTRAERFADEVLVLSGAFADAKCPAGDCAESLRFEFRSYDTVSTATIGELFFESKNWAFKSPFDAPPYFNTMIIQWVNPSGDVLRSDYFFNQDSINYFRIVRSEPWENNERGEKTWKMDVDFSCFLSDSSQQFERRITGNGTIAVAYR